MREYDYVITQEFPPEVAALGKQGMRDHMTRRVQEAVDSFNLFPMGIIRFQFSDDFTRPGWVFCRAAAPVEGLYVQ